MMIIYSEYQTFFYKYSVLLLFFVPLVFTVFHSDFYLCLIAFDSARMSGIFLAVEALDEHFVCWITHF